MRRSPGLIRKVFIWNESGVADGIYLWRSLDDAKAFYRDSSDDFPEGIAAFLEKRPPVFSGK